MATEVSSLLLQYMYPLIIVLHEQDPGQPNPVHHHLQTEADPLQIHPFFYL